MTKEIQLTKGQVALVDDEDYEKLSTTKWRAVSYGYAISIDGEKGLLMHRVIMNAKKGEIVDHKNHNTSDNRKENLRIVTHAQNMMNRKRNSNCTLPKGVEKVLNRYRACISKDGKKIHLGTYSSISEAAKVYNKKAVELFGEFAWIEDNEA